MLFLSLKDLQTLVLVPPMMRMWVRKTSRTHQSLSLRTPPMVVAILRSTAGHSGLSAASG